MSQVEETIKLEVQEQVISTPVKDSPENSDKGFFNAFITSVVVSGVMLSGVFYYFNNKINELTEELTMRPRLLVVDYAKLGEKAQHLNPEQIEPLLFQVRDKLEQLRLAGYMVLSTSGNSTLVPNEYLIEPNMLIDDALLMAPPIMTPSQPTQRMGEEDTLPTVNPFAGYNPNRQ